jgi:tetratricopeptide (TPR) repeat protein
MSVKAKRALIVIFVLVLVAVGTVMIIPSLRESASWHISQVFIRLRSFIDPPEEVGFSPSTSATPDLQGTLTALAEIPGSTVTPTPADTQLPTAIPSPTATPLPSNVYIKGGTYYTQHGFFNYCAPANMAMALSYWGWAGDIKEVGAALKPYDKDKNVMPYEMENYTISLGLGAITRIGGDLSTIRKFTAAGFPVLVEKGVFFRDLQGNNSWMGHYQVVVGYDDTREIVITQDSFIEPDYVETFEQFMAEWKSFNYTYLIIYSLDREAEVLQLLGEDADELTNATRAYISASDQAIRDSGRDQFFSWYNVGSSLVKLQDYTSAAQAYDQAFGIYNTLPKDLTSRPYRILWYQTGPYFAYFYTARYQDVIDLATENAINLVRDNDPALEESFYWRGLAKQALGDIAGAIEDLQTALNYHPGFPPALQALQQLGANP